MKYALLYCFMAIFFLSACSDKKTALPGPGKKVADPYKTPCLSNCGSDSICYLGGCVSVCPVSGDECNTDYLCSLDKVCLKKNCAPESVENCSDLKDNDCNGLIDEEDNRCQLLQDGGSDTSTNTTHTPSKDAGDNEDHGDNTCTGEPPPCDIEGVCSLKKKKCSSEVWITCEPEEIPDYEPNKERTCIDDKDNDCDGLVDENDPDCGCVELATQNGYYDGAEELQCIDQKDNDCDSLTDWSDPDCDCKDYMSQNGLYDGNKELHCEDQQDNDCDGLIDALDPDCGCEQTLTGIGKYEPNTELSCNDNKDNDCDGNIDLLDEDCQCDYAKETTLNVIWEDEFDPSSCLLTTRGWVKNHELNDGGIVACKTVDGVSVLEMSHVNAGRQFPLIYNQKSGIFPSTNVGWEVRLKYFYFGVYGSDAFDVGTMNNYNAEKDYCYTLTDGSGSEVYLDGTPCRHTPRNVWDIFQTHAVKNNIDYFYEFKMTKSTQWQYRTDPTDFSWHILRVFHNRITKKSEMWIWRTSLKDKNHIVYENIQNHDLPQPQSMFLGHNVIHETYRGDWSSFYIDYIKIFDGLNVNENCPEAKPLP